jgi:hypothetical protein
MSKLNTVYICAVFVSVLTVTSGLVLSPHSHVKNTNVSPWCLGGADTEEIVFKWLIACSFMLHETS